MLPDYFFRVAASSTGKYHPPYALGDGGLVRHTKAAVKIAHELLGLDMYGHHYTQDQQDLMLVALILHDGWKHGQDATASQYTVAEHPIVCVSWIKSTHELYSLLSEDQVDFLCGCIASHMGQWNKDYKSNRIILPVPRTPAQKFVHQADYLASRKYLLFDFGDSYYTPSNENDDHSPTDQGISSELKNMIAIIVGTCKSLIENGADRQSIYKIIADHNNGNRNPNSIKNMDDAIIIKKELEEIS